MNTVFSLSAILLLTVVGIAAAQDKEIKFAAADVKADLAYMYQALEKSHYNLYAYTSKPRYDAAYKRIWASVPEDSITLLEATKFFQKLAAVGNIGHCEVDFPVQPYIAYAQKGGTVLPLGLAFEGGTAYIRKNYTDATGISSGDRILSINSVAIKKLQEQFHPYLSAERPYFKDTKLEFWSFPRLYWSVLGEKLTFKVKTKSRAGKISTHTIKAIPVMEYETRREGELLSNERFFRYYGEAAYLHPGSFSSPDADGEAKFKAFIDSAFFDFQSRKTATLILDLRNNAGGHNAYSDYLISYFADKPFRWYSSFSLKTSEILKAQTLKAQTGSETDLYTSAILNHKNGETFTYDQPNQYPKPEEERFKGKVYVLVNRQTYSMAAVSAALIQDYEFAEIVGEETGDIPSLYASQFSFTLPETGISVKAPKGYIIRPNGDENLSGVIPDQQVRDHLLDQEDEILNYLLQKLQTTTSFNK